MSKKEVTLREFEAKKLVELNTEIACVNDLLKQKRVSKESFDNAMSDLKDALTAYNLATTAAVYDELSQAAKPLTEAVKRYAITLHRIIEDTNDNGKLIGVKLGEKSTKISLDNFCAKQKFDREWVKECGQLLALLTLKKLKDYDITKLSSAELAKKSNAFIKYAFEKHAGFTPDSNTKVVKLIQSIIDRVLGEGVYKCTNYDINFIYDCATKIDRKSKCAIALVTDKQFTEIMFEVFAHALGESYKVTGTRLKYDADGNEMKAVYAAEKSAAKSTEKPTENQPEQPEAHTEPEPAPVVEAVKKSSKKAEKKSA